MSPLAYVLYALSFAIIGGCAVGIAHHQWRGWRRHNTHTAEPVTVIETNGYDPGRFAAGGYLQPPWPRHDPEVPIYSELAAKNPDAVRTVVQSRRRRTVVKLTANTQSAADGFARLGKAVREMQESIGREVLKAMNQADTSATKTTRRRS